MTPNGVHRREALRDDNDVTPWESGADVDWTQHSFGIRTAVGEEVALWVGLRESREASSGFENPNEIEQVIISTRSRRVRRIFFIFRRINWTPIASNVTAWWVVALLARTRTA